MTYELDSGRTINIPDKDIERIQKNLGVSYNEAVYTWLVDEDYITDDTVEELSDKAKKNRITATVHQAKAENKEKKERKPREKKENPLKKQIISAILEGIKGIDGKIDVENDEKYINLWVEGRSFTINLVEHREKKEKKAQPFSFFIIS